MAPYLTLGLLGDLKRRDDPVATELEREFEALGAALKKSGLEAHLEPEDVPLWEREYDALDLHCLRRLAANLDLGDELPTPGSEDNVDADELTDRYYELAGGKQSLLGRMFAPAAKQELHFDHLIVHRDADGFYLPIEFERPIDYTSRVSGPGWIGSSLTLLAECELLVERLALPDAKAKGYDRERNCLDLVLEACRMSQKSGGALILT